MPELPFTLDQLRILKAIAAQGSFKKAADLLYVTQPAVSLQIQNLEKQLEITIFDRGGRKALLTEAGRLLLEYCERILNQCDEACKAIEDLNSLKRWNSCYWSEPNNGYLFNAENDRTIQQKIP